VRKDVEVCQEKKVFRDKGESVVTLEEMVTVANQDHLDLMD